MTGRWTISADVAAWDARTREIARHHIALYKQLCPLIRDGDVYHILPQATGGGGTGWSTMIRSVEKGWCSSSGRRALGATAGTSRRIRERRV